MITPTVVRQKVIQSGKFFEVYTYSRGVWRGFPVLRSVYRKHKSFQVREDNINRSKKAIKRLIFANFNKNNAKFVTLTFAENVVDIEVANKYFKNFILRLKRFYPELKYIAIPEFQKRGSVHYHVIMNLAYVPANKLADLWGAGFIKINKVVDSQKLPFYVTKYLTKDIDSRLFSRRRYLTSRNLQKPVEFINNEVLIVYNFMGVNENNKMFEFSLYTKFTGMIHYKQHYVVDVSHNLET